MRSVLFGVVAGSLLLLSNQGSLAQSSLGGFKHDSNQPIEIVSDTLEVRQQDQKAIFSGNVRARQGEAYMQANTFEVTYTQNDDSSPENSMGGIKRVKAIGDVFLSTGTESAQGDWADYDVEAGKITMGDTVALTQNESVITGSALDIDLIKGQARIDGKSQNQSNSGGRVKSIFVPQQ
jgi:lipopolysaccharide export system protein LptA